MREFYAVVRAMKGISSCLDRKWLEGRGYSTWGGEALPEEVTFEWYLTEGTESAV